MGVEEKIKPLRQKIDALDEQILRLLNERAKTVLEVGQIKSEAKMDFYDPRREEEIIERLAEQNSGPFSPQNISSIFREIISACRSLEAELWI